MPHALHPYVSVCDAIAALLHPHAEAVLHDLETGRIFHIANSYSKRRKGDASLNDPEISFDRSENVIGPYAKTNWDGRRLKSVTTVIRGRRDRAIGLLCINFDVEVFAGALAQIAALIELPKPVERPKSLLASDWRESINDIVRGFLKSRNATLAGLAREDLDELVSELGRRGCFEIRNAVPYTADILGLSRATIYNRMNGARKRRSTARHANVARPTRRSRAVQASEGVER